MKEEIRYRIAASLVVCSQDGRILLVREADPRVRGKLNLPGGHLDGGETITACALRELREETGLSPDLSRLIGVYTQGIGIHFIFLANSTTAQTSPGDDILSCEWHPLKEIVALPDDQVLRPRRLRVIIGDVLVGRTYPIELIHRVHREEWEKVRGGADRSHPALE